MANLKEIRVRITSVNSTMQITSAMKMVSAAKLKRAQDAVTRMRPYAEKLQEILSNVSSTLDSTDGVLSQQREVKNVLYVAITSNRGLCGGFNNNVIKEIKSSSSLNHSNAKVKVLSIGKKAFDYFRKTDQHTTEGFSETPYSLLDNPGFEAVSAAAAKIMEQFAAGKYDRVYLVYNRFKNAAVQVITNEQYLPVKPTEVAGSSSKGEYIYEPDKAQIVEELIPRSLKIQIFKAILDSTAAEHGARMTSMHKATDNARDMVKELKLTYNKARQAAITGEILEIVAGAEALKG
jgi:F-type H+-transporting ATPase subunit gamma